MSADSGRRTREIVSYAIAAVQAGLDVFGLGEHHSWDFAVANPAVPPAAIAQATSRIRLAGAVSVLSTADPVRLHQDFASLDLISDGRTEIIAGRSAFVEAFGLFGVDLEDYDDVFAEKLRLLLAIRENPEHVTWRGRFRPAMDGLSVQAPPQQPQLPLWLGVGGTPSSMERAGRLGLPMALGLIGGDIRSVRPSSSTTARSAQRPATPPTGCGSADPATSTSAARPRAHATTSSPSTRNTSAPNRPPDAAFTSDAPSSTPRRYRSAR
ncbi:LLM class flavin-dependent oxidoreductase [Streptomyces iakyrus]|uniref:LLM class flavin-dependent oxidoreductase n=1 Tax=Streptomyces iakyrus TaxID=68219 RepID=A0ABW8FKJ8_9ACTN